MQTPQSLGLIASIALFLLSVGNTCSATIDFSFYTNPFKSKGTVIDLQVALDDPGGFAAETAKAFEKRSRQLDDDDKLEVIMEL